MTFENLCVSHFQSRVLSVIFVFNGIRHWLLNRLSTKTSCCWSSVSYALKLLTQNFLRLCRQEKCSSLVRTRTETSRSQSFEVRTGAVGNKGLVHKSSTSLLSINFRLRGFLLFRYLKIGWVLSSGWTQSWISLLLLTVTDVSTTCAVVTFRVIWRWLPSSDFDSDSLTPTAQVVETSVTVNNNSPIQDYVHPDDQTQPTFEMTPGFKPFTVFRYCSNACPQCHKERHRNLSNIWQSTFKIGEAQIRDITETAPKSPFLCVCVCVKKKKKNLFGYGFNAGARAIRCTVDIGLNTSGAFWLAFVSVISVAILLVK